MPSVIMLSVIMLSVVMLSVVMLNVVAPNCYLTIVKSRCQCYKTFYGRTQLRSVVSYSDLQSQTH
jgi:hypothetical protein